MNNEIIVLPEPTESKSTVDERQGKQKAQLLNELRKMPIVEYACKKVGIGRTTFYRWKKIDVDFAAKVEEALGEGVQMVSDMAESQLLSCIRDKELGAITFWLKHRHPSYASKLEISTKSNKPDEPLTVEEDEDLQQVIKRGDLGGGHGSTE